MTGRSPSAAKGNLTPAARYNLACVLALASRGGGQSGEILASKAVAMLAALRDSGRLKDIEWLRSDKDFDSLRERPDFRAILEGPADTRSGKEGR